VTISFKHDMIDPKVRDITNCDLILWEVGSKLWINSGHCLSRECCRYKVWFRFFQTHFNNGEILCNTWA